MSTITEKITQGPMHIEQGKSLTNTTLEALRTTIRNLRNYLRLKYTPFFDQAVADELSRRQGEYIKILLKLRKQGIPVDIQVELKQGKDEKLNPYSQNPISVLLPAEKPLGRRVVAKTKLSDLGNETLAERLYLLGEKTITQDEPLSYLMRTCSELYALRQDIRLAQINGQGKSARTQKLRSLEYTIVRTRFLETEAEGLTPEGTRIDIETDLRTRSSRFPNINVKVSLPVNNNLRIFYYPIIGTIISADPKIGPLLEKIAASKKTP